MSVIQELVDCEPEDSEMLEAASQVKNEMDVGPVVLQPPDYVYKQKPPRLEPGPAPLSGRFSDVPTHKAAKKPQVKPGSSGPLRDTNPPQKKRSKRTSFTSNEKEMVFNLYTYVKATWPADEYPYKTSLHEKAAEISGIGVASVYKILKERAMHEKIKPPINMKKRPTFSEKLDDFDKSAIRKKVYSFFLKGELPTFKKVLQAVNEDETLPIFKRATFQKLLKHLKFKYIKLKKCDALLDRDYIVLWRRKFLEKIKEYRRINRRIFYVAETWVNAGHTVRKTCVDTTVMCKRKAFIERLKRGKHVIALHIGSENGFVEGAGDVFESKSNGDYHETMESFYFEQWFKNILPKLGENAVVIMDNASYNSRRQEKLPAVTWQKANIQQWLRNKQISYDEGNLKAELLHKVKLVKAIYQKYAVDELAKKYKVEVLRLPPYHCELNPMVLVWAEVMAHVTRYNKTFKHKDVKKLLHEGIENVSADKWRNCMDQIINLENNFYWKIDDMIDNTVDSFITSVPDSDSSTEYSSTEYASSDTDDNQY